MIIFDVYSDCCPGGAVPEEDGDKAMAEMREAGARILV